MSLGMDPIAVSVEEAARQLGLSKRTTERRIKSGALRSYRDGGRRLVRVADVMDYVERGGQP